MATQVAARQHDRGGETERRMNGLRWAGKTAGLSRVRRAAFSRSHEGHSVGRSGEARSQGAYSQPAHPVKQRENSETTPRLFTPTANTPVVYARWLVFLHSLALEDRQQRTVSCRADIPDVRRITLRQGPSLPSQCTPEPAPGSSRWAYRTKGGESLAHRTRPPTRTWRGPGRDRVSAQHR